MSAAVIVHQRTGREVGRFAGYVQAAEFRRDVLRPALRPESPCPYAIRDLGRPLAIGDVFTAARAGRPLDTHQCPSCGRPVVDGLDAEHVEIADNGAVTAWTGCRPADLTDDAGHVYAATLF